MSSAAAITYKALLMLPVDVLTTPIIQGATIPPVALSALMRATPTAAAEPLKSNGGTVQKIGNMATTAAKAIENEIIESRTSPALAVTMQKPSAAPTAPIAQCQRRSSCR